MATEEKSGPPPWGRCVGASRTLVKWGLDCRKGGSTKKFDGTCGPALQGRKNVARKEKLALAPIPKSEAAAEDMKRK